jgi:chlorophyll synthase
MWQTSRPAIWLTSVVPFYVGWLVGSHTVWPSLKLFADTLQKATSGGITRDQFWTAQRAELDLDGELLLAFLVVGPLFWLAALLLNDAHDVAGDRLNPRKSEAPLVLGIVTPRWALRTSAVASVIAIAVAALVSGWLALITVMLLVGNYAYSTPPWRWKTRPGADVLTNALGIGVLAPVGGWAIDRPIQDFPGWIGLLGFLVATALYIPTTLVDADADREAGYTTVATSLGPRRAYRIGLVAWLLANALAVTLSATSTIFPHRMLTLLLIAAPLMVLEYVLLIGRPLTGLRVFRGLVVLAWTFLLVNIDFVLLYGGLWVD